VTLKRGPDLIECYLAATHEPRPSACTSASTVASSRPEPRASAGQLQHPYELASSAKQRIDHGIPPCSRIAAGATTAGPRGRRPHGPFGL
jgi:hypothetical protein